MERILEGSFTQVFAFVDYNVYLGIFGKYLNILSTFAWNFIDIFIMAVSVALSEKFRQINVRLETVKNKVSRFYRKNIMICLLNFCLQPSPESFWVKSRTSYRNLCQLCEEIDDAISPLTVLSFVNNLYFICGKFLKSIQLSVSVYFFLI